MFFVYVLENPKGILYKGFTENLENRIQAHNQGSNTSTRKKGPWKLVYHEEINDKKGALQRERFLKSGKGREFLKSVLKNNQSNN